MWLAGEIDLSRVSGTIDVEQAMREEAERQRFASRQQRELEWIALKAWWTAVRRLTAAEYAGKQANVAAARANLVGVIEAYGPALEQGREKWKAVQRELQRRGYHRLD